MTKEEKNILLKDLCARLQYKPHCRVFKLNEDIKENDDVLYGVIGDNVMTLKSNKDECLMYYQIKPYLRPMNSMTEEEAQEIRDRLNKLSIGRTITNENFEKCCDFLWFTKMSSFECVSEKMMDVVIDYLDENMFDHRGLIEKGLAIKSSKNVVYL